MAFLIMAACAGRAASAEGEFHPLKPADTSSPRATLNSFIDGCNEIFGLLMTTRPQDRGSAQAEALRKRIVDCLDRSELPEFARQYAATEAAVHLKEVLDRIELPPDDEIPDAETIAQAGGRDELTRWRIPNTRITIAVVQEGPLMGEYLFSAESVMDSVDYYDAVSGLPYRTTGRMTTPGFREWYLSEPRSPAVAALVRALPDWSRNRLGAAAVWQWIGLFFSSGLACAALIGIYRLGRSQAAKMRDTSVVRYCMSLTFLLIAMLIPLAFKFFADDYLTLRGMPLYVTTFIANLVLLATIMVLVTGATNRLAEIIIASPRIHPHGLDAQLIRIVCRLSSIVASIVVFLEGGRYLGVPLTTLVASAGVGGLAVALAAQDTLKSLFGSMMILLDKPYRVGERIVVGEYDGVVEEIGLRSTKLKLLTGHFASIPNEEMARNRIENVGRRPHIRRIANLQIPLNTPREKVECAIQVIRSALENHEGMEPDFPPRVFFNEFNPDAFNIRIMYWYHPPDYWKFLAFSERLNFDICRAFEEQRLPFALPLRVTHTSTTGEQEPLELKLVDGPGTDVGQRPPSPPPEKAQAEPS